MTFGSLLPSAPTALTFPTATLGLLENTRSGQILPAAAEATVSLKGRVFSATNYGVVAEAPTGIRSTFEALFLASSGRLSYLAVVCTEA